MKHALICFIKFPAPGNVKTRLAVDIGLDGAANLYKAMAERVITEVYPLENDYDLILYMDPIHSIELYRGWIGDSWAFRDQSGGDLGDRLNDAATWALQAGYDKVALIGSDCIGMDQAFIEETFTQLDDHDYVIGPSNDGGYYLIAMKEPSPWLFNEIEWSTNSVLSTTLDKIDMRDLKVKKLEEKMDVDTLEDLIEFKEELPDEHFLRHKIEQIAMERVSIDPRATKIFVED